LTLLAESIYSSGGFRLFCVVRLFITPLPGFSNREILQKPRTSYTGQMVGRGIRRNHSAKSSLISRGARTIVIHWVVVRARALPDRERREERYAEPIQLERELQHPLRRSARWRRVLLPRRRWRESRQELASGRRHVRVLPTIFLSVPRIRRFELPYGWGKLRRNVHSKFSCSCLQAQQGLGSPTHPRTEET